MHPLFPEFKDGPRLTALHTTAGKYIYLDERAFASVGIATAPLMGRTWQDFAPADEVDAEVAAVGRALASGLPVQLAPVLRTWTTQTIALDVKITPVRTQRGTTIILREAQISDPLQARPHAKATAAAARASLCTIVESL